MPQVKDSNPYVVDSRPPARKTCFRRTPFLEHCCTLFRTLPCTREAVDSNLRGFLLKTRAFHVDVVPSMDTSRCVMGIETFRARLGVPSVVLSDNRTNFVPSATELLFNINKWNQQIVSDALVKKGLSGSSTHQVLPITHVFANI